MFLVNLVMRWLWLIETSIFVVPSPPTPRTSDKTCTKSINFPRITNVLVADWIHIVGSSHIGSQTFWCLVGHLDAILQDGHREPWYQNPGKKNICETGAWEAPCVIIVWLVLVVAQMWVSPVNLKQVQHEVYRAGTCNWSLAVVGNPYARGGWFPPSDLFDG